MRYRNLVVSRDASCQSCCWKAPLKSCSILTLACSEVEDRDHKWCVQIMSGHSNMPDAAQHATYVHAPTEKQPAVMLHGDTTIHGVVRGDHTAVCLLPSMHLHICILLNTRGIRQDVHLQAGPLLLL